MGMRLIGPVYLVGGQDFNMVYLDWPANDANCYLVDTGDPLVLIDCGCGESLSGILTNIEQMGFKLDDVRHVLLTHAHLPHAGAAEALRRNGARITAGPCAADAITEARIETSAWYYAREFVPLQEVTRIEDGETIKLGRCEFLARHLPGHSPGSFGYELVHEDSRMLFCGDVVRSPALEQVRNRPGYDHAAYNATLLRLLEDPPDVLYPGHGPFCLSHTEHWIAEELKELLREPEA